MYSIFCIALFEYYLNYNNKITFNTFARKKKYQNS